MYLYFFITFALTISALKDYLSSPLNMGYRYINTEYLEMVTGDDRGITEELIDIFRQQIEEFGGKMKELYDSGSYSELGLLAHKAKSSVAIMGMNNLAGQLKELEMECRQGTNTQNYPNIIGTFRDETTAAINELDDYLLKI